ncbi:MAG TPA: FAD-dependent oxidoreductase, partial [Limnochordia bacterium]|nr:FAD-dependent oxidoreductase [Limnochordia bacterium]
MTETNKQSLAAQVVIIGGGIVGTAVARELSRYKLDVLLLEAEAEVGWGTTKAN